MKDALNNPVVVGNIYGYSASQSSRITVVIGKLLRMTEKKVTLEVISRRNFLYGEEYDCTWAGDAKTVSVHPCHLFPVDPKLVTPSEIVTN